MRWIVLIALCFFTVSIGFLASAVNDQHEVVIKQEVRWRIGGYDLDSYAYKNWALVYQNHYRNINIDSLSVIKQQE